MITTSKSTTIRQRQILSAAEKVIVKYGSENVTVRRIAKEIGVSEGALYRHFKSKREVLSMLIDDVRNNLLAGIDVADTRSLNSFEDIERVITQHMSGIVRRKGISFQVIAEIVSLGDKRLNNKIFGVIGEYTGRFKDILAEGIKAGVIRQDIDLDTIATLFFGMTQGLVNIWALSNFSFNLEEKSVIITHPAILFITIFPSLDIIFDNPASRSSQGSAVLEELTLLTPPAPPPPPPPPLVEELIVSVPVRIVVVYWR